MSSVIVSKKSYKRSYLKLSQYYYLSCLVMFWHVLSCIGIYCQFVSHFVIFSHFMWCLISSCHILLYFLVTCHVLSPLVYFAWKSSVRLPVDILPHLPNYEHHIVIIWMCSKPFSSISIEYQPYFQFSTTYQIIFTQ